MEGEKRRDNNAENHAKDVVMLINMYLTIDGEIALCGICASNDTTTTVNTSNHGSLW